MIFDHYWWKMWRKDEPDASVAFLGDVRATFTELSFHVHSSNKILSRAAFERCVSSQLPRGVLGNANRLPKKLVEHANIDAT